MTVAQQSSLKKLEVTLSKVAGFAVEITIRSENAFTFSAEGNQNWAAMIQWLASSGVYKIVSQHHGYDAECDLTCLYFTVA